MRVRRHLLETVLSLVLAVGFSSCGSPGPPLPPSLELPRVVTDLRATRKGDRVTLVWTAPTKTTDLQNVRHLGPSLICRSLQVLINECVDPVGQVPASELMPAPPEKHAKTPATPTQARYVDVLPADLEQRYPTSQITYAVETQNTNHRAAGLSNQVRVSLAPTLPAPADLAGKLTADGVVLTWTGIVPEHAAPELRYIYRVYRRDTATHQDSVAGEIGLSTSPEAVFTDRSFEWQKTYQYRVTGVTLVPGAAGIVDQVEGEDSKSIEVVANDTFPPAVPSGLQAVASGVGQRPFVDLTWAPVTDADLSGYNVFRHEEGMPPVKINNELVKTPAFRDNNVEPGKIYFYSISAVDLRGNESARSEEASETLPNP